MLVTNTTSHHLSAHTATVVDANGTAAADDNDVATASGFAVSYHVSPPVPDWVFHTACSFLVLIGSFGATANLAVIVLFAISPRVRRCQYVTHSDI